MWQWVGPVLDWRTTVKASKNIMVQNKTQCGRWVSNSSPWKSISSSAAQDWHYKNTWKMSLITSHFAEYFLIIPLILSRTLKYTVHYPLLTVEEPRPRVVSDCSRVIHLNESRNRTISSNCMSSILSTGFSALSF